MPRINPQSDSYEALMWDVITNAHCYTPRWGENVLDLGAHFGMFSLFCAARGANVHAYEPSPEAFVELTHTAEVAKEIRRGEIIPHPLAIYGTARQQSLYLHPTTTGGNRLLPGIGMMKERTVMVQTVTLKTALKDNESWDCVKVDIEGAEYDVFASADDEDFARISFLTIEIHNDILSLNERNILKEILTKQFKRIKRLPVYENGVDAGLDSALFCWRGE
jgi:FkbM family methyltransferase